MSKEGFIIFTCQDCVYYEAYNKFTGYCDWHGEHIDADSYSCSNFKLGD